VNRDIVERILRDYDALHRTDTDPELEAVRVAILLEDIFGIALSDAEIDLVLTNPADAAALVTRLKGGV